MFCAAVFVLLGLLAGRGDASLPEPASSHATCLTARRACGDSHSPALSEAKVSGARGVRRRGHGELSIPLLDRMFPLSEVHSFSLWIAYHPKWPRLFNPLLHFPEQDRIKAFFVLTFSHPHPDARIWPFLLRRIDVHTPEDATLVW